MKRISIVLTAVAVMFASSNASAQKLSNLLKSVASSDVVNTVVNTYVPGASAVSLPGSWSYTGSAISLTSDNTLTNVAGSAVTSGVEKKLTNIFRKSASRPALSALLSTKTNHSPARCSESISLVLGSLRMMHPKFSSSTAR